MEDSLIVGFLSLGGLLILQFISFIFGYGRLHQKAKDIKETVGETKETVKAVEKHVAELNGTQRVHTKSLEIACHSISRLESESKLLDHRVTKVEFRTLEELKKKHE